MLLLMNANAVTTLRDRIAAIVNRMGYIFVGCELKPQGRRSVFRIYIDNESGVTLDGCSKVSRQISAMLDVEDPIQGEYTLEISSPGLNRPLFELAHYQKQIDKRIKVHLRIPINGQSNFVGMLLRVENDNIHLLVDAEEKVLPFSDIEKANVIADIR
jgi:ribosome maturation factor RimP